MLDFLMISTKSNKRGVIEIYPKFIINNKSSDLMIRGSDFYAIWIEDRGLWSTDEQDALQLIDKELDRYVEENKKHFESGYKVLHMWDAESGMIDLWHKYCQKQSRDHFKMLDEKLIFSNSETNKKDYASKCLDYPLEEGDISAWDKLISTLYSEEERRKIEWAIGSIVTGDSKKIQKFMVLYGAAGTGKSTILNIIQQLFNGYYSVFDAKALGSSSNAFALEAFKTNPLVAIQHDGDLSRIEDNTRLNSLVSHEIMTVNEKFKSTYANRFKCFLFMGTNKPVKITDAKSGLIRRLIDVTPSGDKLSSKEYKTTLKQISFELGAIAYHCKEVYLNNQNIYDDYIPTNMLGASNDFYNFVMDSYFVFKDEDGTSLKTAWEMYKTYCDDAKVSYPLPQRAFKEELKNYFENYSDRYSAGDGSRIRSYYSGFKADKFEYQSSDEEPIVHGSNLIEFKIQKSIFDEYLKDCPAQYATTKETPTSKWDEVKTNLSDIDTTKLHYVRTPESIITIDFDIPDEHGNKCFEKNLAEASKWPPTYAELSKSGQGIHLEYLYSGDTNELSHVYDDYIEIKTCTGKSSLRRKLTKCNNLPIATISSGLPLKGDKSMVNFEAIKSEKGLRARIKRCLNKEPHPEGTKPNVDFIYKTLEDTYNSGIHYDVSDMRNAVLAFAANSTHQANYCIKLVNKMKFKSDEPSQSVKNEKDTLVFYDIEVFPNLFLVNWKFQGKGKPVIRMINPTPDEIEDLVKFKLVGFNCRRYDNHLLYARILGYNNAQLYDLSQKIINKSPNCFFGQAYNISYTDVYDFASSGNKKSLKKLEIEMGIHHQELGLPWDEPVPEELWTKVAEYCDNDVIATEAAFEYLKADWTARQILADLAGLTVNDTTNTLTTKIIFGNNKTPQGQFNYRDLSKPVAKLDTETFEFLKEACPVMMSKKHGPMESLLPYFPGYKHEYGVSTYRGLTVGEGGFVYAEPGVYRNVALIDVSSMHPHSAIAECVFGVKFTKAFREIVEGRVSIKHEAWHEVDEMMGGKLKPYIQKVKDGEMTSGDLANALKTAINSVYGLTSAGFDNPFRDKRNIDNIIAKRGALFMIDLKHEVESRGFTVAHIKTDSIKIPDATPEIIQFCLDFAQEYGYTFEHEATYEKMCLVNNAVYIAKFATVGHCCDLYGEKYVASSKSVVKDCKKHSGEWTATGTQFQIPYVFKTLFSKEPIKFDDMCETKSVTSSLFLDMNEDLPDVSGLEAEHAKLWKKINDKKHITEPMEAECARIEELSKLIEKGHSYHFIGKVGQFCPVKPGCGGGILLRKTDNGYAAATGTIGYRWMESEMVRVLQKQEYIDKSYYQTLVDRAVDDISKYCDFEQFVSDDVPVTPWTSTNDEDECPFDVR